MEKDYREKIKKLLALAESPNEHEAKAALLKAKELMAEHKLSEAAYTTPQANSVLAVCSALLAHIWKNVPTDSSVWQ